MHENQEWARRQFLKAMGAVGLAAGAGAALGGGAVVARADESMLELSATELVRAFKNGDFTTEAYAKQALARADRLGSLNMFVSLDREQVLTWARKADQARASGKPLGPLHGLPVTLKDLINTGFAPTSAGTPALSGNIPVNGNARIVDLLTRAGAVPFGKANMHELSFGATSVNPFSGPVGNPYSARMIAGGSSGGPAAAPAARVVPVGIGGDTAGSIRIPASLSGVCGLRPSLGRWPGDAKSLVPISNTRDTLGPLARTCADLELVDRVVTGSPRVFRANLRKVKLAKIPHFFSDLEPGVEAVVNNALAALKLAGVKIQEADPVLVALTKGSFPIMMYEVIGNLTAYLKANTRGPISLADLVKQVQSPDVGGLFKSLMPEFGGKPVPREAYLAALAEREALRAAYAEFFSQTDFDAIVFPTTIIPATPIEKPGSIMQYIHNTDVGSMAGMPGTAQPIGLTNGLPVSLGLDGPVGSDRKLLSIAMAMETHVFGRLKPPAV